MSLSAQSAPSPLSQALAVLSSPATVTGLDSYCYSGTVTGSSCTTQETSMELQLLSIVVVVNPLTSTMFMFTVDTRSCARIQPPATSKGKYVAKCHTFTLTPSTTIFPCFDNTCRHVTLNPGHVAARRCQCIHAEALSQIRHPESPRLHGCLSAPVIPTPGARYRELPRLAHLAYFSNLSLIPACYDHHSVARLHMHGYPHRFPILVELI